MSTIPNNLRVFLAEVRLPRDVREKIAEEYAKSIPISGLSWEFGFIHGRVSEELLEECARQVPNLLIRRDKVNDITHENLLLHLMSNPECFGYFMRKFSRFEFNPKIIDHQVSLGNLEILKLIYEFGIDAHKYFLVSAMHEAALYGKLKIIKFLHKNLFWSWDNSKSVCYAIDYAAKYGNLANVCYLYEKIFRPRGEIGCTYLAINNAVKQGNINVVRYIYEEIFRPLGEPGCRTMVLTVAAGRGNLKMVKYLYEEIFRPRGETNCANSAINKAAENGHLEVVKYFYENVFLPRGERGCTFSAIYYSLKNGHDEIIEYINNITSR